MAEWISTKKRLPDIKNVEKLELNKPKYSDQVLIIFDGHVLCANYCVIEHGNMKASMTFEAIMWDAHIESSGFNGIVSLRVSDVAAWMPMPEALIGKEENSNAKE